MIEVYNLKGKKVKVSKKMFDHIYKNRGFKPVGQEEMTKQDIMDKLDAEGIEYNSRMTKKELLELM